MSKLHAAIIFWVGTPFLPINGIWFSCDTQARTYVSSIAPIQFYIKKNSLVINWNVVKIFLCNLFNYLIT
jgi:hypothetical protein